jgi:NAD(P)-dependent dehydrogenase (short-subunit alcohol dehydrogenase family)
MGPLEAHEFGKHGITVNAYAPGIIDTRLSQRFFYLSTSG